MEKLQLRCPSSYCKKLIYKEQTNVYELRKKTKNKEQSLKSLQLKEQEAENVSVNYCHP
jgi:hypothetical protein